MAFERCKNCGGQIDYHEATKGQKSKCPHCHQWQVVGVPKSAETMATIVLVLIVPLCIGIFWLLGSENASSKLTNDPQVSLAQFMEATEASGTAAILERCTVDGDTLIVTVHNYWHSQPKQMRLQAAQNFWAEWAAIHSPSDLDNARIRITDRNGNNVGGSRTLGGSMIWVTD